MDALSPTKLNKVEFSTVSQFHENVICINELLLEVEDLSAFSRILEPLS